MLNKRMLHTLEILIDRGEEGASIRELSETVGVSERTTRYDIDTINRVLISNGFEQIQKKPKGLLFLNNPQGVQLYFSENFQSIFQVEFRYTEMLVEVLFSGKINITNTCKKLHLSRTTVRNDLLDIRKVLEQYNLNLGIKPKEGLILDGEESNIRRLQVKVLGEASSDKRSILEQRYITTLINAYMDNLDSIGVDKFIRHIAAHNQRAVSDNAMHVLRSYTLIAVWRLMNGFSLNSTSQGSSCNADRDKESKGDIIRDALHILKSSYGITFWGAEASAIEKYFLGSHLHAEEAAIFFNKDWLKLDGIIEGIVRRIESDTGASLMQDDFLMDGLINHIKPTIHRVKNGIELKDSIYEEIAQECPDLLSTMHNALVPLEEFIGTVFPNEEVALLAVHFQGAIRRNQNHVSEALRVLLVCGDGQGVVSLIEQQLVENYNIEVVGIALPSRANDVISKEGAKFDLIVTTASIDIVTRIPITHIKTVIINHEIQDFMESSLAKKRQKVLLSNIMDVLSKGAVIEDRSVIVGELQRLFGGNIINDIEAEVPILAELLTEENIYLNYEVDTWQEAVIKSGRVLEGRGYVAREYTNEMVQNIKKYGSYVVVHPYLAIPHADKKYVIKSGMSLIVLKKPVLFPEGLEVDVILAFASSNNREHLQALSLFIEMVKTCGFIDTMREAQSARKIIINIKKYEFLMRLDYTK